MRIAVVVSGGKPSAVLEAFQEEQSALTVLDAGKGIDALLKEVRAAGADHVVAADAGAVAVTERLQVELSLPHTTQGATSVRTRRAAQRDAVGALGGDGRHWRVSSAAELAQLVARHGELLVASDAIGSDDVRWACRDEAGARAAFDAIARDGSDLHAAPMAHGRRFGIDTVSASGHAVVADIHEHRVDERGRQLHLRHRLGVAGDSELARRLGEFAVACIEAVGIRDGAAHVEVMEEEGALRAGDILAAPSVWAVPADAAFVAYGYSHAHLIAEQVLRPAEFARRVRRAPPRARLLLAVVPVRVWRDGVLPRGEGLRLVRRLGGFHSLTALARPGDAVRAGQVVAWAAFVGTDADWLRNSVSVLHEIEDTHSVFVDQMQVIDYSANVS